MMHKETQHIILPLCAFQASPHGSSQLVVPSTCKQTQAGKAVSQSKKKINK